MTTAEFWSSRVFLRWMQTQWCNYRCWYCRQDHTRKQMYRGAAGHWIDNAPLLAWVDAFDQHFAGRKLSLSITGGEPMLDKKNMDPFLQHCADASYVDSVRVDTNGSWDPAGWRADVSKVRLMVSYHSTETTLQEFRRSLDRLLSCGWKVAVVNIVVDPARFDELLSVDLPIPVAYLLMYGKLDLYTAEQAAVLRSKHHAADWPHRAEERTKGKPCLFPSTAYEMEPDGSVRAGCTPELNGSLFGELPVRRSGYTPCPYEDCCCVDKYGFLEDMPPVTSAQPLDLCAERLKGAQRGLGRIPS